LSGTDPGQDNDRGGPSRIALIALLVVAVLAVGGYWLFGRMRGAAQVQDCVMAGRTNCAPVGQ
jgi:hypothetical protein